MKSKPGSFRCNFVLPFLVSTFALSTGLQADTFEIRGGGIITGKLVNKPTSSILQIRTYDGVELEIPSSKLIKPPTVLAVNIEEAYKSSLVGKDDTAELHRAVSLECVARDQTELSIAHKERIVELEPTKANWAAIGYSEDKLTGEMVPQKVLFKRKGMVKVTGRPWDTPQSIAIADFISKQDKDVGEMNRLIDQQLKNLTQRGPLGVKAAEFFNTLVDPVAMEKSYKLDNRLAIKKIYELIKNDTSSSRAEWYLAILAKMPENSANWAFVDIAMLPNAQLVNQAIELLERTETSREYAFHGFLNVIRDRKAKPGVIDRAGSNLQSFVDKRAIPTLIEHLFIINTYKSTKPATNSISSDGGISQNFGNITEESKSIVKHPTVLSALLSVVDGVNYEYNIPEWRIWYANTFAKFNMDLRRDE